MSLGVDDCLLCRSGSSLHTPDVVLIQFDSPDDEHCVARNIYGREIKKLIEKSVSSWLLTRIIPRCTVNEIYKIYWSVRSVMHCVPRLLSVLCA